MRILCCGDRKWIDKERIYTALMQICKDSLPDNQYAADVTVIHGGCRGADMLAGKVAAEAGMKVEVYLANWKEFGFIAGPIRNQEMLDKGKPDITVAFHNDLIMSKGTKDMVKRSIKAGLPTWLVTTRSMEDLSKVSVLIKKNF